MKSTHWSTQLHQLLYIYQSLGTANDKKSALWNACMYLSKYIMLMSSNYFDETQPKQQQSKITRYWARTILVVFCDQFREHAPISKHKSFSHS